MANEKNILKVIVKILIAILVVILIQFLLNKYIFFPQTEKAINESLENTNAELITE